MNNTQNPIHTTTDTLSEYAKNFDAENDRENKNRGLVAVQKTGSSGNAKWRNLFASIVSNTSLTMKDMADLRIKEMEDLLEGMNENAEEQKKMLDGVKNDEVLEGDAAIKALMGGKL